MNLRKLIAPFRSPNGVYRSAAGRLLHSPDEFKKILRRESGRSDRTGMPLSVIAFGPESNKDGTATMAHLVEMLARRVRCTDEIGWLDRSRIAALLPDTPQSGARTLAEEIVSGFHCEPPPPSWTIYSYPTADPPSRVPWVGGPSARSPGAGGAVGDDGQAVHPLEVFFVASMPRWKRTIDLVGAAVGLVLLAPLFVVVAAAIKATSPGPVFFGQKRSGRGGKPFVIYKFRSMVDGAHLRREELASLNEQDGPAFKMKADPRVTRVGRFLRATSMDELPQLWNVLKGDMSLVGPRPLPCDESDACQGWHRRRLEITPGMTCIWQVRGQSAVSFSEWVRMDLRYARSVSSWHDLKLLGQTVLVVLRKKAW